jgi:hypothetical protein
VGHADRHHRLGEQREGGDDRDQHHRRPAPVQPPEAGGGQRIQQHPCAGHQLQLQASGLLGRGDVQGRQAEQGHGGPRHHQRRQPAAQQRLAAQHRRRPRRGQLDAGDGGEAGRQQQADRGGDGEAGVAALQQDPRGGEGVQQQEAGAGQEHQRHQEQAGVSAPPGHLAHAGAEGDVDSRHRHHQREVAGLVPPDGVQVRLGEQQPQPQQRQDQVERPDGHAQRGAARHGDGHGLRHLPGVSGPRRPGAAGRGAGAARRR